MVLGVKRIFLKIILNIKRKLAARLHTDISVSITADLDAFQAAIRSYI